jgi:hypothetical protein
MKNDVHSSANPLITKVQQLFSRDLALENDYLRQENRILRDKLGSRMPLIQADRLVLVKYGHSCFVRSKQSSSIIMPSARIKESVILFHWAWTILKRQRFPGRSRASMSWGTP